MAFPSILRPANIVISLLMLVIAGLLINSSLAQSRILCFKEDSAVQIYTQLPSLTPTRTLTPTKTNTPTRTSTPPNTSTPRPSSTTVILPTTTLTPFPTNLPITQVDPRRTQETTTPQYNVQTLQAAYSYNLTHTPGYNASTAIYETGTPTSDIWGAVYIIFRTGEAGPIKTRNCGTGPFSINCPTNPTGEWLQARESYVVDVNKAWCAQGTLSGTTYLFVLTDKGWAAWRTPNSSIVYLIPAVNLTVPCN